MHKKNSARGFTLIELLFVIAIIAVLSSVVFAQVSSARSKARDVKRAASLSQIQKGLDFFYESNQTYPSTTPAGFTGADAALQLLYVDGYINIDPSLSPTDHYVYYATETNTAPYVDCTSTLCPGYVLGVELENISNEVLSSDADTEVKDSGGAVLFEGQSVDCGAGVGNDLCLDKVASQPML